MLAACAVLEIKVKTWDLYDSANEFIERVGVPVLSLDFEILYALHKFGPQSANDLWCKSRASKAGFSCILRRLADKDLIVSAKEDGDRRKVIYSLSRRSELAMSHHFA